MGCAIGFFGIKNFPHDRVAFSGVDSVAVVGGGDGANK
jgi:hypothetical protein